MDASKNGTKQVHPANGQIHHEALRKKDMGISAHIYDSEDIGKYAPWLWENLNIAKDVCLEEQERRGETARMYPAHMFDHGLRTSFNGIMFSTMRSPELNDEDIRNAVISGISLIAHDIKKGDVDEETGRDLHAPNGVIFVRDNLIDHLTPRVDDRAKKEIVRIVGDHEEYRLQQKRLYDTVIGSKKRSYRIYLESILEQIGLGSRRTPQRLASIGDMCDRADKYRIKMVLNNLLQGSDPHDYEGAKRKVFEFMKYKWFNAHGMEDDIFEDVEGDWRPEELMKFDDDVRKTLDFYLKMLKSASMDEDGGDIFRSELQSLENAVFALNLQYQTTGVDLRTAYDAHIGGLSRYFSVVE
jgi:hypothetical protein